MQSPKVGVFTAGLLQGREEPGAWQLLFRLDSTLSDYLYTVNLHTPGKPSPSLGRWYSHHEASRWFTQTVTNVLSVGFVLGHCSSWPTQRCGNPE